MVIEIPAPIPDKCEVCGKCVEVLIRNDPYDFRAPKMESECSKHGYPVDARHMPGPVDVVTIYFVGCD